MSPPVPENQPPRAPSSRLPHLRLGILLACLAGLLAYLLLSGSAGRPARAGRPSTLACAGRGTPHVLSVAPLELGALRNSVARVLPGRVGRLYEEGTVSGSNFWSDEPPAGPSVSRTAHREAGYEMRWWAPNGDDVVADVLEFASPGQAGEFMQRAAERRCGHLLLSAGAGRPPQGRDLAWTNPDGVAEADVFLARGSRVYRVGDVPAGQQQHSPSSARLRHTLAAVDALACLLPGAHCESESRSVPA